MNAMTQDLTRQCRDYQRITAALHYLHAPRDTEPSLAEIAQQVGLSEFHFQRLFSRWAGISPKRYLQFLHKSHARALLRESAPVLETALSTGLSGPGRLHDLLVTTEAVSPGEFRSGGQGLHIRWAVHASPFGDCLLGLNERGICHLGFIDESAMAAELALRENWPGADLEHDPRSGRDEIANIFLLDNKRRALSVLLKGTNFQIKVWEALLRIPQGRVGSYRQLAEAVDSPKASRAVGSAIGANSIAYLIPCHRVIRSLGEFGGYRWGGVRKQLMLAREVNSLRQFMTG